MLSEAARRELNRLVFQFLGPDPSVVTLEALLRHVPVTTIPRVSLPFQRAVWVVDKLLQMADAEHVVDVIEVVDPGGTVPTLQAFKDALSRGQIDLRRRQTDDLVVLDDGPFVDRDSVREAIREMFSPAAQVGCLVVAGGIGEGKSYLREWCAKLAMTAVFGRFASFHVDGAMAAGIDPGVLAIKLATDLGIHRDRRPRRHEDLERWASDLAEWLTRHVVGRDMISVVMLDGLHHPQVPACVHTFVRALLLARQRSAEVRQVLRVVLLGYDPGSLERQGIEHEYRILEHVDKPMVRQWFAMRYPGRPEWEYDDAATEVFAELPPPGPARMRALCVQIRAIGPELEVQGL